MASLCPRCPICSWHPCSWAHSLPSLLSHQWSAGVAQGSDQGLILFSIYTFSWGETIQSDDLHTTHLLIPSPISPILTSPWAPTSLMHLTASQTSPLGYITGLSDSSQVTQWMAAADMNSGQPDRRACMLNHSQTRIKSLAINSLRVGMSIPKIGQINYPTISHSVGSQSSYALPFSQFQKGQVCQRKHGATWKLGVFLEHEIHSKIDRVRQGARWAGEILFLHNQDGHIIGSKQNIPIYKLKTRLQRDLKLEVGSFILPLDLKSDSHCWQAMGRWKRKDSETFNLDLITLQKFIRLHKAATEIQIWGCPLDILPQNKI